MAKHDRMEAIVHRVRIIGPAEVDDRLGTVPNDLARPDSGPADCETAGVRTEPPKHDLSQKASRRHEDLCPPRRSAACDRKDRVLDRRGGRDVLAALCTEPTDVDRPGV